jgi:hypothetical protein
VQSRMRNGVIRRTARRSVAVAVLGWLAAMGGSVLVAPTASAEPAVTVPIRDLTPPVVSVDANGTVTFVNEIPDKPVQVGGAGGLLPSLVNVTVHTDVTLRLPSGTKQLPAGASVTETFAQSCVTCSITYTYRMDSGASLTSAVTGAVTKLLPPLPLPTPFIVNTLVELPNLPGVNLPTLPQVNVPGPTPPPVQDPTGNEQPPPGDPAPGPVPTDPTLPAIDGNAYNYSLPAGAPQLAPTGAAGTAFDTSLFRVPGSGAVGTGSGSGGVPGGYDGANVPTFGQLAGLSGRLDDSEDVEIASDAADLSPSQLSVPALLAVIALAGTSSALVRARRAQRAPR